MRGRSIPYSDAEIAWIAARAGEPRRALHAAFIAAFGRGDISFANFKAKCTRAGIKTGRTGCFPPGQTPANKGRHMPLHPNSAATRFKKGNLPHNTNYAGHERVTQDGYIEISVNERNPHTGFERRYVLKHLWRWRQINGPLPAGHCLKCRDGNRLNTEPENWELVPRAILPRLNGGRFKKVLAYDEAAPALRPAIMAVARLDHAARKAGGAP